MTSLIKCVLCLKEKVTKTIIDKYIYIDIMDELIYIDTVTPTCTRNSRKYQLQSAREAVQHVGGAVFTSVNTVKLFRNFK